MLAISGDGRVRSGSRIRATTWGSRMLSPTFESMSAQNLLARDVLSSSWVFYRSPRTMRARVDSIGWRAQVELLALACRRAAGRMAVGRWGLFRVVTPAEHLPLMRTCLKQRAVLRQIRGVDRRQHQAPSMTSRRARTCRKRTTTRSKSPAQWPKTSRARPAPEVQTLIHPISIPVTSTSVNSARSSGPALFAGG
jgi:hypothetical protein